VLEDAMDLDLDVVLDEVLEDAMDLDLMVPDLDLMVADEVGFLELLEDAVDLDLEELDEDVFLAVRIDALAGGVFFLLDPSLFLAAGLINFSASD
jgi:hypothetical protein